MSRPLRIEYEGAWYHVMNRGAGKKEIFHTLEHYELFLGLLNEIHNRYRIEIHAYCLMPNHYHLLIHTPLANLSRAIKYLNGLYTQRYNKLLKTDGPLFRGRFKSIIVDADNYLLTLNRYIHLNPVVAQIVKNAEQYRWSSYSAYLDQKLAPRWLTINVTLSKFGASMQKQNYRTFIAEGIDKKTDSFFKKIKRLPILGSEAFVKTISQKYLNNKKISAEISDHRQIQNLKLPTIEEVMQAVANYYKVGPNTLKYIQRRSGNTPRAIAIYLACQITNQKLQNVVKHFTNISYSGVSQTFRRVKRKMEKDIKITQDILTLKHKILANK